MKSATHMLAHCEVRYWEDANVNGRQDEDGTLIPNRFGDEWRLKIDIATGRISDWPFGTFANVHYKVCDAGKYWLLDAEGKIVARWRGCYVPDDFLCHGDQGYGDYVILTIGPDGQIAEYTRPEIVDSEWELAP